MIGAYPGLENDIHIIRRGWTSLNPIPYIIDICPFASAATCPIHVAPVVNNIISEIEASTVSGIIRVAANSWIARIAVSQ